MTNKWLVYYNEGPDKFYDDGKPSVDMSKYRLVANFGNIFDTENSEITIIVADNRVSVTSANVNDIQHGLNIIWAWMNNGSGQEIMPYWLCLRSMSVGDVVRDPDGKHWYCASAGWRQVEVEW